MVKRRIANIDARQAAEQVEHSYSSRYSVGKNKLWDNNKLALLENSDSRVSYVCHPPERDK